MQVFCIQCGGWHITVERSLGVPITYLYRCRDCNCCFDSWEWERFQKENCEKVAEKKEELQRRKSEKGLFL